MISNAQRPKYPGTRITTNGNQLVASYTEPLYAEAGVFYPITPSTEQGENFQNCFAKGQLNAFGDQFFAIETEGEHAAQGGAIAASVTGKRAVNFTSGQGVVYGVEQYYHAPGKLSTMVLQVGARALTKHALNVHCGHDDIYAAMDTGWIMLFAKDAQQAADQSMILRRVTELALNPGMNIQDGFLTTHLERTFYRPEPGLVREFLGHPADEIPCPTAAQRELFGPTRRRVPECIDLARPQLLGPVQNQEHYMNGVAARRNNFSECILDMLEESYERFGQLTGRRYGLISQYRCDDADTVFIALGSAAENIEAGVDHLRETSDAKVGVIHINVIRPFPENALIEALRGKEKVIILERTDESLAGDNPLTRDIRGAISKACDNHRYPAHAHLGSMDPATEKPRIFAGVYGLGSRDFRPEGILGAYEFAHDQTARQDGKRAADGADFFYLGIDHPYAVTSAETPSLLPEGAIPVRFHSVGGWGMITTGKNLGEILGTFSNAVAKRDGLTDENGDLKEVVHISANPKYGSEKKGAPTNYFMVAAPDRIRVNCDLRHVKVVLCCDPKAFLHTNPLEGLEDGGAFVWESNEPNAAAVWQRIPRQYRQAIIDKGIRVFALDGFKIAREATDRGDLQTRMQGNSFLGAFFGVSSFLADYRITEADFLATVRQQYEKKFGRFGEAVVESNMTVMQQGFSTVVEIPPGAVDDPDTSGFTKEAVCPVNLDEVPAIVDQDKPALYRRQYFNNEFRAGLGYDQPASPLASVGVMAAATGLDASKYVSRREVPRWIPENCTQCMDCIAMCPDSALPNTAQDIQTVLRTAVRHYVSDPAARQELNAAVVPVSQQVRQRMKEVIEAKDQDTLFTQVAMEAFEAIKDQAPAVTGAALGEIRAILEKAPWAFHKTKSIFQLLEKKKEGEGGLFAIYVNDLCKGCAACVDACGDHQALEMIPEGEDVHAEMETQTAFLDLFPDTPQKYLGLFDAHNPQDAKAATLRFHLMLQSKYAALVSGDGACAGCGEKSVLRAVATLTETLMRPIFHAKAERLLAKADALEAGGLAALQGLKERDAEAYERFRRTILHQIMGYGGCDPTDTQARIAAEWQGDDPALVKGLVRVMQQDAHNHREVQTIEGKTPEGMCAMAMAAHTGCNTVFGSTPPNNPHPYPWMNSLFQDGATVGWLIGESFIQNHTKRSVLPERFADLLLSDFPTGFDDEDAFIYTHFRDQQYTDTEALELPKVWVIGGDGGMGDIGFQNVSKAVLQNRPNVKLLMLNTQVYSNTGGQNSDSSVMPGGFDMNQLGPASQGKLTEMKNVAECFLAGHGSPFVAQVSMANSANLYKAMIDGLCYRGTAYFQVFTTCQPEHGVPDDSSQRQAQLVRDSRCLPEFVFNPSLGETYQEALSLKGNSNVKGDWIQKRIPGSKKDKYTFTVAHWAFTEARFRQHHQLIKDGNVDGLMRLEDVLERVTMDDVIHHRYLDKKHHCYIPARGVYAVDYTDAGKEIYRLLSRQMVLFCIERRKAWRLLQSRASVPNADYEAQKEHLKELASAEPVADPATVGS